MKTIITILIMVFTSFLYAQESHSDRIIQNNIQKQFKPHHIALRVSDVKSTVEWYKKIFGATVLRTSKVPGIDPDISIAMLKIGYDFHIEIVGDGKPKPTQPKRPASIKEDFAYEGYKHIGFMVYDYDKVIKHLKSKGVNVFREVVRQDYGVRIALFYDINGFIIEIYAEIE